jgi:hypothetical protein
MMKPALPLLLGSLMVLAAACDGGGPAGGVPTNQPPLVAAPGVWTWVDVPGSQCSDGTPTGFAVNPQASDDLFIYFEGGGACWDYLTCFTLVTASGPFGAADWPAFEPTLNGPFDRTRASNPMRNATMVYIPYCTGDLHVGDNVAQYQYGVYSGTYHHKGMPNTIAFLSLVASTWRKPARVVYGGSSAGGYGAALSYPLMRQTYPDAKMYLVDDAGTLLEGDALSPSLRSSWITSWNIGALADSICIGCRDDFSQVYPALAGRYPKDRMALLSSQRDVTIRTFFNLTPDEYQTDILAMVHDRLNPLPNFHAFLIAGEQHTLLWTSTQSTTNGVVLETWLDDMLADRPAWATVQP